MPLADSPSSAAAALPLFFFLRFLCLEVPWPVPGCDAASAAASAVGRPVKKLLVSVLKLLSRAPSQFREVDVTVSPALGSEAVAGAVAGLTFPDCEGGLERLPPERFACLLEADASIVAACS